MGLQRSAPNRARNTVLKSPKSLSNPATRQSAAHLVPCAWTDCASRRTLLQVHRSGAPGSPRVVGSTSASRFRSRVGSLETVVLRPAPGRRTRSEGSSTPISSAPVRSCSVQSRSPSRPPQSLHNPRRTPRPPRANDGPVRQERAPPPKTSRGWVRYRSPPQYMVWKNACKPMYTLSKVDSIICGRAP